MTRRADSGWVERLRSIEEHVDTLLSGLGIRDPQDLDPIEDICWACEAEVRRLSLSSCEGQLVRVGRKAIITVDSGVTNRGRYRFAVGHELGHHRLHHGGDQLFICTSADMLDFYKESSQEREANGFSASLLMPRSMFAAQMSSSRPDILSVIDIAEHFATSLTATAIRMVTLSRQACAIVMSRKDGVVWWHSSDSFSFAINNKNGLSKYSFAYDALAGCHVPNGSSEVDPDTWLYFNPSGERLFESSMLLGNTGYCLTILWLRD